MCRRVGHDLKHCLEAAKEQEAKKQYGEWMRAGWNSKGGQSKTWTTGSEAQTMAERELMTWDAMYPLTAFACLSQSVLGETKSLMKIQHWRMFLKQA